MQNPPTTTKQSQGNRKPKQKILATANGFLFGCHNLKIVFIFQFTWVSSDFSFFFPYCCCFCCSFCGHLSKFSSKLKIVEERKRFSQLNIQDNTKEHKGSSSIAGCQVMPKAASNESRKKTIFENYRIIRKIIRN